LPLAEDLENPLLGILVLRGRTLGPLEPADHVLHGRPSRTVRPLSARDATGPAVARPGVRAKRRPRTGRAMDGNGRGRRGKEQKRQPAGELTAMSGHSTEWRTSGLANATGSPKP